MAGSTLVGSYYDYALVRLNTNGSLDTGFGSGGKVTTNFSYNDVALAVAVQADGKILAGGYSHVWSGSAWTYDFSLARYHSSGTLDTSFDSDGKVTTAVGPLDDYVRKLVVQPDGKILAAGYDYSTSSTSDIALVRYNSNGSRDPSFGSSGKVTTNLGALDYAMSAALQTDGKIVLGGYSNVSGATHFCVLRYNPGGTLDGSFDGDGWLTTALGAYDYAFAVAVQADGRIVAAGYGVALPTSYDLALTRYTSNGSLDPTFDGDGIVLASVFPYGYNLARAVAVQPDGKIVASGYAYQGGGSNDVAVYRYTSDGSLDSTFAGTGKARAGICGTAYGLVLQPDGKIVTAGSGNSDSALTRFNSNGSVDTAFGSGGLAAVSFTTNSESFYNVARLPDGRFVAAGYMYNGTDYDFTLARFTPGGSPDGSFAGTGKLAIPVGPGSDFAYSVAVAPDGKLVAAGYASNGTNNDFAVVRYHPDGTPDFVLRRQRQGPDRLRRQQRLRAERRGPAGRQDRRGRLYVLGRVVQNRPGALQSGRQRGQHLQRRQGAHPGRQLQLLRFQARPAGRRQVAGQRVCQRERRRRFCGGPLQSRREPGSHVLRDGLDHGGGQHRADYAYGLAVQADGRIVAAGSTYAASPGTTNAAVVRLEQGPPVTLSSPHGWTFDLDASPWGTGQILQGPANAFDGLGRLQVNGTDYTLGALTASLEDGGRTLTTPPRTLAGLAVHREVTVPSTGNEDFARTINVFENATGSAIAATVRIVGNLGSGAATTVFGTADGDTLAETTDRWIGTDDADNSGTPGVHPLLVRPVGPAAGDGPGHGRQRRVDV